MLFLQLFYNVRTHYLKANLGDNYTVQELRSINLDWINGLISLSSLVVYIVTIIFFSRWFKRAYQNVSALGFKLRYSKNMSVGAWFIPVFHWIGPIQMMLEIYRNTESVLIENSLTQKNKIRYFFIFAWWFLYILAGINSIFQFVFIYPNSARLESTLWIADYILFVNLLNFVLTILAIIVVINYRKLEIKLIDLPFVTENKMNGTNEILDDGIGN